MERFHAHTPTVPRDGRLPDTFTRKRLSLTGSVDTIAGTRLLLHCPGTLFRLSYQFLVGSRSLTRE